MEFSELVKKRKSKRWYLDKPVPDELIKKILHESSLSPSFMNGQPWEVAVVRGKKLRDVAELLDRRLKENRSTRSISWDIPWPERQRDILARMNAGRPDRVLPPDDPPGIWMYYAPVGLFMHIHKDLNEWALFDLGLFVQSVLLSAANLGVDTVPQARMGNNNDEVASLLGLDTSRRIIMGVVMGYADPDHPNNKYNSPRENSGNFTTWHE